MYRYKRLKEELEDMDDHTCAPHSTAEGGSNNRRNSQEDPDKQERAVFHSQFSEEEFQRDLSARPKVTGPGGIFLPRLNELSQLVNEEGRVTVMCFTWNIACKANRGLHRLNAVFAKIPSKERPDLIAVALQELPPSTFKFHNHVVEVVGEALCTTHRVYCWVRKWSQMFIIFIRKRLSIYTSLRHSDPEYKFIATNKVAKPFKTKGAIGICFRVLQTSCVFIACHLTHGQLKSRIMDYHKLSRTFDFDCLKRLPSSVLSPTTNNSNNPSNGHLNHSASPPPSLTPKNNNSYCQPKKLAWSSETVESLVNSSATLLLSPANSLFIPSLKKRSQAIPMKKAANVFWFGDLNFRVLPIQQLVGIGKQLENRLFRKTLDYESIIGNDELNLERSKGLLFEDFKEGVIKFPPTHKFVIGTSNYADNRVPSYTDRVLYWSNNPSGLIPLRYDCIWEITTSDHKPVYCLFGMKAIERTQLLPESTFNLPGALIDLSDTLVEPANTHQNGKIL